MDKRLIIIGFIISMLGLCLGFIVLMFPNIFGTLVTTDHLYYYRPNFELAYVGLGVTFIGIIICYIGKYKG